MPTTPVKAASQHTVDGLPVGNGISEELQAFDHSQLNGPYRRPETNPLHPNLKAFACPEDRCVNKEYPPEFNNEYELFAHWNENHNPSYAKKLPRRNWWCHYCHMHFNKEKDLPKHHEAQHKGLDFVPIKPMLRGPRAGGNTPN